MLEGKVAIITGATRGIGYMVAEKYLENGAKIAIFGSKKESVDKALGTLKEKGEVIGFYPNLNDPNEIKETFAKIKEIYGKIDILVNNAGVSDRKKLEEYTYDDFKKVIDINLNAVFNCSKEVLPYLKENGGVILNTSSVVSLYGQPSGCAYPASKSALNGLTKSLARELGKYNIRVNAVAPGIIKTDMVENLPKEMIEPLINNIPLKRIGTKEDVANAFLFLASDMASYISGAILSVDGAVII